jgi:hypothetical protein
MEALHALIILLIGADSSALFEHTLVLVSQTILCGKCCNL